MLTSQKAWAPMAHGGVSILRHLRVGLVALFFAGCAGGLGERAAQSCPSSIPAPDLQAGDTWNWQDEKGANWYRRYVRQTPDGLFEREGRSGAPQLFYDHAHTLRKVNRDGLWITAANADYPDLGEPVLVFPLQTGKSWSAQILARERTTGTLFTYNTNYSVLGCERVTVPAGTFFAVAIEEHQALAQDPARANGVRTWWYAPDVKYFVKLAHGRASHPGYWSAFRDWALTSYQVASAPASQPQAGPTAPPAPATTPGPTRPAQEIAKAVPSSVMVPTWERGYEWKFRWSSPRGSGTFVWTIVGEEIVNGIAHYVMRTGTRDILYTKDELAWLMDRVEGAVETRAAPAYRVFAWPLETGKEWETRYRWENPGERRTEDRVRHLKVEALESVTVPAGTFHAFHVTAKDPTGRVTHEEWYSPEIKWIVKERTYFSYGVRDRELLEYRLTPSVSPASPALSR